MPDRHTIAELLAVGTELTTGGIHDTNSGELAADLAARGIEVRRMTALPDRLDAVRDAVADGLSRADLVVSTGGLGPTPDDLTREAIGAALGETPRIDADLEAWLRALFERRGAAMPEANLKQAWLIPSAEALPNAHGTAPGWWVARGGRYLAALPGPPREMRPMWREQVLPRLQAVGLGRDHAARVLRTTGLGESAVADRIGEAWLRRSQPEVATYVRPDGVDVRISAFGTDARSARELVDEAAEHLLGLLEGHVFGEGDTSWAEALEARLAGRTVACVEIGTGGQLGVLLGRARWLRSGELLAPDSAPATEAEPRRLASRVREATGTAIGLCVRVRERGEDLAVSVAMDIEGDVSQVTRTAFLQGDVGRQRAALIAAAELWARLGSGAGDPGHR